MKRPTMLVEALLRQAALDLDLSVERDIVEIRRRSEHEGLSFLTITLPLLSDALERGLEKGLFTCPSNFSRHGQLPLLLGGFVKRVFDKDGRLLPDCDPEFIYWIRQICRFFKKLKIGCTERRETQAIRHFLDVEGELHRGTSQVERLDYVLDNVSRIIWPQVFPEVDYCDLVCHHGPGFTADRRLPNERSRLCNWNDRSEVTFPSDLHCYPNYGYAAEEAGRYGEGPREILGITYLSVKDELPVRVVFVPKTQTAPRVIAIEPSHMQFMQQSVKDLMYETLETHRLTKRSIHFIRQDVNQRLAYRGSIDKRTSTLDLKDASDRVHLHLVQRIFKTSGLLEYLEDARSLHATLPNGQNIVLNKYASMGSALCFPVEACVFYTLIQSAMHQLDGIRPSSRSIEKYSRLIDIYGDDIIVPVEYSDTVVRYLESYLLKVNVSKSFTDGYFRESCGADFYKGVAVKPVYARTIPPDNARDWGAEELMSWNATADLFYQEGKWLMAQFIRDMLRSVAKHPIPRSRQAGPGLFHYSYLFDTDLHWNADLCGWKQKRTVFQPTKKKDEIDGDAIACLNRWGNSKYRSNYVRGCSDPLQSSSDASSPQRVSTLSEEWSRESDSGERGRLLCLLFDDSGHASDQECNDKVLSLSRVGEGPAPEGAGLLHLDGVSTELLRTGSRRELEPRRSSHHSVSSVENRWSDYLIGDTVSIDFKSSVKRGGFKSKRRWIALS